MTKLSLGALVMVVVLASALFAISSASVATQVQAAPGDIVDFHSMIGNTGGPSPGSPVVAGINPAGAAWTITAAEVDLSGSGQLQVNIQGLVLVSSLTVPSGLMIEATLACQTGTSTWTYATTSPVPLPSNGNANINQVITLPTPCDAPIVLIRSSTSGSWFAVTGYTMAGIPRGVPEFPLGLVGVFVLLAPLLVLIRKVTRLHPTPTP